MSRFDDLYGAVKHKLTPDEEKIFLELATGNKDRDLVAKAAAVTEITYSSPYWRDSIGILSGINPVGPATAPTADPDGEGWLFAGIATDNVAVMGIQINHDSVQGSITLYPHLHWRKTTAAAGNVLWRCEYKYAAPGQDFGAYVQAGTDVNTPISATIDNNTATRHLITEFGPITLSMAPSLVLLLKISRIASDTVNDTYNADALALSLDIHYPVDSPGTRSQYLK